MHTHTYIMTEKLLKSNAPFGVATQRFAKIGFHPELDVSGAMKKEVTKVGPGSYNPKNVQCVSKQGFRWKTKVDSEEFSKYLGFRNARVLYEREFDKTLRGPGACDINENIYKKQSSIVRENIGFGSEDRLPENVVCQDSPPPNIYFKNLAESFQPINTTFSKTPTFEYAGLSGRFKSELKSYHLPPNIYTQKDNKNTSDIIKKTISLRGPYDCFTGRRDESTIKNYFSASTTKVPDYFYVKPSDFDYLLKHPDKRRCGLFLKSHRFPKIPTLRAMLNDLTMCYRDPKAPGPAHYDLSNLHGIKAAKESIHPFNSSNINARPPTNWEISPGPGRYSLKVPKCMKQKRPSWVFLTKQDRQFFKAIEYSYLS